MNYYLLMDDNGYYSGIIKANIKKKEFSKLLDEFELISYPSEPSKKKYDYNIKNFLKYLKNKEIEVELIEPILIYF